MERLKLNLPNKITVVRLFMVIIMIILFAIPYTIPDIGILVIDVKGVSQEINIIYLLAAIIFVLASITDFIDGYLARKLNLITDLGRFLDPIADKILTTTALIFLAVNHEWAVNDQLLIPWYIVLLMILRDVIVDGMRMMAHSKHIVVSANIWGKSKTVLQMIAITLFFLNDWPFSYLGLPKYLNVSYIFLYLALIASLVSGAIYMHQNRSVFAPEPAVKEKEDGRKQDEEKPSSK